MDLVSDILQAAPGGEDPGHLAGQPERAGGASLSRRRDGIPRIGRRLRTPWSTVPSSCSCRARGASAPTLSCRRTTWRTWSRICRLVEGMPLGILLAAAWVEMLTPDEIAHEWRPESQGLDFLETDLRDVPERQRSMRAVFDHSWNLLLAGASRRCCRRCPSFAAALRGRRRSRSPALRCAT